MLIMSISQIKARRMWVTTSMPTWALPSSTKIVRKHGCLEGYHPAQALRNSFLPTPLSYVPSRNTIFQLYVTFHWGNKYILEQNVNLWLCCFFIGITVVPERNELMKLKKASCFSQKVLIVYGWKRSQLQNISQLLVLGSAGSKTMPALAIQI